MNKSLKRVIVSAMALSLLVPAVLAPKAEAAAKPKLSAKSVNLVIAKERKENRFSFGKEKDWRNIKRKKGRKNNFDCES